MSFEVNFKTLNQIVEFFKSPEKVEILKKRLCSVLEFVSKIVNNVLYCIEELRSANVSELRSANVSLRIQHRQFVRRLDTLIGDSFEYIDTVKRIPYFDEELTQSELSEKDEISDQRADVTRFPYMGEDRRAGQNQMFDPTDTTRFSHTIRFLGELKEWLDRVEASQKELRQRFDRFHEDTAAAACRAQKTEERARDYNLLSRTAGTVGTIVGIAGAVSGPIGWLALAGGSAVASYALSEKFQEQEKTSQELKSELDKLQDDALMVERATLSTIRSYCTKPRGERDVILGCKNVSLREMKKRVKTIFCALSDICDYDDQRQRIQSLMMGVNDYRLSAN